MTTQLLVLKKTESEDKAKYDNFYSKNLFIKIYQFINESDIHDKFQSLYSKIIINIQNSLGKGSGWVIDLAIDHISSSSNYNPLSGSRYIKFHLY